MKDNGKADNTQDVKTPDAPDLPMMVRSALFTALIIIGAYIRLPIGPVPITLSSFFVLLSPLLLGKKWALISTGLYLLLGAVGLPVFSAGGGVVFFFGPTGGYLIGYLPAVLVTGIIAGKKRSSPIRTIAGLCLGTLIIYGVGVSRLKQVLDLEWKAAFGGGMLPFLVGDSVKIIAAAAVKTAILKTAPGLFPEVEKQARAENNAEEAVE